MTNEQYQDLLKHWFENEDTDRALEEVDQKAIEAVEQNFENEIYRFINED